MKQRTCFIICPIGDEGSDIRNDADLLHDFIIRPVLAEPPFAMKVTRADKLGQPGMITNQIIHEIESVDLVVADLSLGNPNVFYEIAIRHVTRKPFVHLIKRGERIPFDNAPVRAVEFDLRDLRSVDSAKKELAAQAESAIEAGTSESPVSIATTMDSLRQSGNSEKIALADVLAELSSLRGALDQLTANQIAAQKRPVPGGMFGASTPLPNTNALHPNNALGGLLGLSGSPTASTASTSAGGGPEAIEKVQRELDQAIKKLIG